MQHRHLEMTYYVPALQILSPYARITSFTLRPQTKIVLRTFDNDKAFDMSPEELKERLADMDDVYGHLFEGMQQESTMSILEFLPQTSSGTPN